MDNFKFIKKWIQELDPITLIVDYNHSTHQKFKGWGLNNISNIGSLFQMKGLEERLHRECLVLNQMIIINKTDKTTSIGIWYKSKNLKEAKMN